MLAGHAACGSIGGMSLPRLLSMVLLLLGSMPSAQASAQLALDQGCYACHGDPPRRGAPGFAQLATSYARYQGQAQAPRQLAEKLHKGSLFGHIAAHERLSLQEGELLMRWIIDGAR
jgi:cytochrome c